MTVRLYAGIENLGLTGPQKATLVAAIQALGANSHVLPSHRNHWRTRLDNDAVIFEAEFQDTDFTAAGIGHRLAQLFGVADGLVTAATQQVTFSVTPSPVVTYSYQSVAKVRCTVFGGLSADWATSHTEVLAYLAANRAAWESAAV